MNTVLAIIISLGMWMGIEEAQAASYDPVCYQQCIKSSPSEVCFMVCGK